MSCYSGCESTPADSNQFHQQLAVELRSFWTSELLHLTGRFPLRRGYRLWRSRLQLGLPQ